MAGTKATASWKDFPQKLVLAAFGILFTMLVTYFIWLGTAVMEVRAKVVAIEAGIVSLNRSRNAAAEGKSESNKQRLDALEEEGEGTE